MKSMHLFGSLLCLGLVSVSGCASTTTEEESSEDALTRSSNPNALFDLPFYFSVNADSLTAMTREERDAHPYPTFWNPAMNAGSQTGLRVIAVPDSTTERTRMAQRFAESGTMRAGDVLMNVRVDLASTIPYVHLQMGATHAGMVRIVNGRANGVDQPLDADHNAPNAEPFSSRHYRELKAMHILRPRSMDSATKRQQLDFWQAKAQAVIGREGRPGFNDNYLAPATAHPEFGGSAAKLAHAIGRGLLAGNVRSALGIDLSDTAGEQQLFCSELVYHLLTLANCTEDDIRDASPDAPPSCLDTPPFAQMPFAGVERSGGLGEGPLLVAEKEPQLLVPQLPSVFCQGVACNSTSSGLSAGHRAANAMLLERQVPQALGLVYQARAQNPSAPIPAQAAPLSQAIPPNYSPAAFVIETLKDAHTRGMDYVATIVFVNRAEFDKASELSSRPIPRTYDAWTQQ
jgi:hypothetical protein